MTTRNRIVTALAITLAISPAAFAGHTMKWDEVPEPVRKAILANGGKEGPVDREGEKVNGKALYEASVKDKDGAVADLEITEDGKLVEIKHDDAADKAAEEAAAKKAKKGKNAAIPKFSHPRDIFNPYLPLAYVKQDILEGQEGGKKVHIERTAKPDMHKTIKFGDQMVDTLVFEDREIEDGQLAEVALDYFAQSDDGTVYYLGEDVDEYEDGKLKGHEGSWMLGKDTQKPGVILPAHPKVGDKFRSEDVSKEIREDDEVVSVDETVVAPAGTYNNCVKVKEHLADGTTEYKYYAPGVGVVREIPSDGNVLLKSHDTK